MILDFCIFLTFVAGSSALWLVAHTLKAIEKKLEYMPVLRYNELTGQMFVERPLPDATEETSAEIFKEPTKEEVEQYQREQNPLYSAVKKLLK